MKVNFYTHTRGGDNYIYLSFHFQGKRLQLYTGEKLKDIDKWDKGKQRVKPSMPGSVEINGLLRSMEEEVYQVYREARILRIPVSVQYMRDKLTFVSKKSFEFFDLYDEFVKSESKLKDWRLRTIGNFKSLHYHLESFNKLNKLDVNSLDALFQERFVEYFTAGGYNNSTIEKYFKFFNWYYKWLIRKSYIHNPSIDTFRLNKKTVSNPEIIYLTIDELERVSNLNIDDTQLHLLWARDVFLFGCFTGLRYSDIKALKKADIREEYITITLQKTSQTITVPLNKHARDILNKYKNNNHITALPVVSNQKLNKSLKEIGKMAKLDTSITRVSFSGNRRIEKTFQKYQLITTHTARKTFITISVFLKIPLEVVIAITGQSMGVIKQYYEIQEETKREALKKFDSRF